MDHFCPYNTVLTPTGDLTDWLMRSAMQDSVAKNHRWKVLSSRGLLMNIDLRRVLDKTICGE